MGLTPVNFKRIKVSMQNGGVNIIDYTNLLSHLFLMNMSNIHFVGRLVSIKAYLLMVAIVTMHITNWRVAVSRPVTMILNCKGKVSLEAYQTQ